MDRAKELLLDKGITPSIHRLMILKYLADLKEHPTADNIYQSLVKKIPTLSKTTVYNTLKTFVDKGIIEAFSIANSEVRYEFNPSPHAHFKCKVCHRIYDIEKPVESLINRIIEGHEVHEHHTNLIGICRECLKKREK